MTYIPAESRYDAMNYRRCGKSGLLLPALSLGLWHNFGNITPFENGVLPVSLFYSYNCFHFFFFPILFPNVRKKAYLLGGLIFNVVEHIMNT